MKKFAAIGVSTIAVVVLGAGVATASGGGSSSGSTGTWPTSMPLPTNPGRLVSQSSTTAVVRSTDSVATVQGKLDSTYAAKGCTRKLAVNLPRDYLCRNAATGKTDEVYFTFAALDPTASDPSRSQTNGFYLKG
ncbi:hypothetical protein [Terrabacter terrigena]|uniref:Uncharacterized protein n=1 Tax=Terrabacter terrigena TaxID=574718 RepID=A0ABW3MYY9_9MICO